MFGSISTKLEEANSYNVVVEENESNERRENNKEIKEPKPKVRLNIEYKIYTYTKCIRIYRMQFEAMPYQHCRHSGCILINFNRCYCDVVASAFLKRFPIVIHYYNVQSIEPKHDLQYHAWNFFIVADKVPSYCNSFHFFWKFQHDYYRSNTNLSYLLNC